MDFATKENDLWMPPETSAKGRRGVGGESTKSPSRIKEHCKIEGKRIRKFPRSFLEAQKKSGSRNNLFPWKAAPQTRARIGRNSERELYVKRSKVRGCQSEAFTPFKAVAKLRIIRWHSLRLPFLIFPSYPNHRLGPQGSAGRPRIILLVGAGKLPSQLSDD